MNKDTAESAAPVDGAETVTATPANEQEPSRSSSVQRTSKWLTLGIPVLVVALIGYGYSTGHLQQAASKASASIASIAPGMAGSKDHLTAAREAFAAGEMNAAIAGYRALIASKPDDMSASGELGNVYYANGQTAEAAQSYFETANLAIEKNQLEVAEALLPVVSEGNPQLADKLNDKLNDAFDAQMRTEMSRPQEDGYPLQSQQQG